MFTVHFCKELHRQANRVSYVRNLCCESDAGLPRNMGIYDLGYIYAQL